MDKLTKVSLIATHVHRPPLLRVAFGSGYKGDRLQMSFVLAFEQEERCGYQFKGFRHPRSVSPE